MKLLKSKKVLILAGFIILVIVIIALVLFQNSKNSQSSVTFTPVSTTDITNFISTATLPANSQSVEREEIEKDGFVISAAKEGNIDSPVTFAVGEGKVSFTSIGNSNLGRMNNSELIVGEDGKITYENIFNGINLIYTPSKDKILEEYEVRAKRKIDYIVQKIDMEGLKYEKKEDGSIIFTNASTGEFAFAVPRPVMYEKYNTKEKSFGLHYEFIEYGGNTYLAKIIDEEGQKWLESRANYPVMIDATILLTLFSYTSYATVDGVWQIDAQTVGKGDLTVKPGEDTTWSLAKEPDSTKDLNNLTLSCDGNNLTYQISNNEALFSNFSCDGNIVIKSSVSDPTKQNNLDFSYSGITSTVTNLVDAGKPIIVSSSLTPPIVKIGDTITVTTEVADTKGVASVSANMGGVETISLKLNEGTLTHGTWTGKWIVHNTATKPYEVLISASNINNETTLSSIGFFDPYTCLAGGDHAGADWNPATDCAGGFAGDHTNIGILNVSNGQTATVQAFDQVSSYGIATMSASVATIAGTLTAMGKGWSGGLGVGGTGSGPGGGTQYGGGSYGGTGGGNGGNQYGSLSIPGDIGSGGSGGNSSGRNGSAGGGSIRINTTGVLTVNGTITANGTNLAASNVNNAGSGSGGSIYLSATDIAGSGTITSNGGNGSGGQSNYTGGGGRIAIYYSNTNTFSGTTTVAAGSTGTLGTSGTAFVLNSSTGNLLIPSSNGTWNGSDNLNSWTFRNLTINGSVTFQPTTATLFTLTSTGSATIASGITITARGSYTTNSNGVGVYLNLTGDVTIPATTTITATGQGYAGGLGVGGTGSGPGGGTQYGGGSYGGVGGGGGGSTYGSLSVPVDLGSGGSGGNSSGRNGSAGGGSIRINTTGVLTVNGTITANGTNLAASNVNNAGSGSGGSIYIYMKELQGTGNIYALGGNGSAGQSNYTGAGGRIAMYCTDGGNWLGNSLASASATANGITGTLGANGTVYTSNCYTINPKIGGNTRFNGNIRIR